MPAPMLMFALCFCTDGQHVPGDRETFREDRDEVERGLKFASPAEGPVHLVQSTQILTVIEPADVNLAAHRRDVIATFAERFARLPVDVEVGCDHPRAEDICANCSPLVFDLPGKRVAS